MPPINAITIEHQLYSKTCSYGKKTTAKPVDASRFCLLPFSGIERSLFYLILNLVPQFEFPIIHFFSIDPTL